jgi:hypothetical protein
MKNLNQTSLKLINLTHQKTSHIFILRNLHKLINLLKNYLYNSFAKY